MQLVKFELYKLCKQRMIWISFLILLVFYGFTMYMNIYSGNVSSNDYSFYQGHEGEIDQKEVTIKQKELTQLFNQIQKRSSQKDAKKVLFLEDYTYAGDQLVSYKEEITHLENQIKKLEGKENSYQYRETNYRLAKLKEIGEPKFYYIKGWANIAGFTDFVGPLIISILILIGISSIFSKEYSSGMYQFILSSKNGRKSIVTAKILVSFLYVLILTSFFFLLCSLFSLLLWGFYGYNIDLRNISLFQDTILTLKAWQYILIEYGILLLGALAYTSFIIFISAKSKSSLSSIILGIALLGLPSLLIQVTHGQVDWVNTILNFSYLSLMSVIRLFSTSNLYNVFGIPISLIYLILPIFVGLSILFIYGTFVTIRKKQYI